MSQAPPPTSTFWCRWLSWLWPRPTFLHVGWGWPAVAAALVLTLTNYVVWNAIINRDIQRAFERLQLSDLTGASSTPELVKAALDMTEADPKLETWLKDTLVPHRPASEQLEDFFGALAGAVDPNAAERRRIVRELATGQQRGWPGLWLTTSRVSGAGLLKALKAGGAGDWEQGLKDDPLKVAKRAFVSRYADRFLVEMTDSVRVLNRWNGWVQWWTVFAFWLIVAALCRRGLVLWRLWRRVGTATTNPEWRGLLGNIWSNVGPEPRSYPELFRESFGCMRVTLENDVYGTYAFLLGLLPSLGFIGTVLGMGDALLEAEGMFTRQDRQRTIGKITQSLGFAFDTTYVALFLGVVAGLLLVCYRYGESLLLRRWEEELGRKRLCTPAAPRPEEKQP